mmetsp:Transcript_94120/g.266302  ORF Transcript_94120/g.266302 Transcript_94120/m.266302 type:complete len:209 (+) Transcript_94120:197-823(+)
MSSSGGMSAGCLLFAEALSSMAFALVAAASSWAPAPSKSRKAHGMHRSAHMSEPQSVSHASFMHFCSAGSWRDFSGCELAGSDCHKDTTSIDGSLSVCFRSVAARRRKAMASAMRFRLIESARAANCAHVRSCSSTSLSCSCRCSYTSAIVCMKLRTLREGKSLAWFRTSRQRPPIRRTSSSLTSAFGALVRSHRFSSSTSRVRGSCR